MKKISTKLDRSVLQTYGEIVRKDCYKMNYWPNNFFHTIIDIGANVGIFSVYAHMRHPASSIYAYEPCKETFQALLDNTWYLEKVKCYNKALGDGSPLTLHDTGWPVCNLFFKDSELKPKESVSEEYSVESLSLVKILQECELGSKCCLKIDCEGGERFILEDKEAIEIIKEIHMFALEVHFPPKSGSSSRFSGFPSWETYNEWIFDNFGKTHRVLYHMSDGKKRGAGTYVLSLKA